MTSQLTLSAILAAGAVTVAIHGQATGRPPGAEVLQSNDYRDATAWLCRPGRHDACDTDLTTTVIAADGTLTRETWTADPNAPIDCFYVYPTVSIGPAPYSDMNPGLAQRAAERQQLARFASMCRLYAPIYRQVTLEGLRRMATGDATITVDRGVGFDDVRDAWNYYLQHDNKGRGVVLIGHSQGSRVLTGIIQQEIDGQPAQSRLVSALLAGTTIPVPRGRDVGGAFQHVPLCHSASETGCVITYASFRSTRPPPANTLFGTVTDPNMMAACTNPAALGGATGELHAYLPSAASRSWVISPKPIDTPWVSLTGLLTARCATNEYATYLEVTVHGDPAGPRASDIPGDVILAGRVQPNWGLHLIDMSLAMGNLLEIVAQQAKAYRATSFKTPTAGRH